MQDRFKFRYIFRKDFGGKTGICYKMPIFYLNEVTSDNFTKVIKDYTDFDYKLVSIEQSTGLKDKNGKLIYEGDIVADVSSGCISTIEYLSSSYSLMAHIRRMDEFIPIEDICFVEKEGTPFEIIGNIYENPELLKDGEQ